MSANRFRFIQAVLGNFFEHYDMALFSLLAPFLASLFFHNDGSYSHLLSMAYLLMVTHVSRFFGAICFSFLGDSYGAGRIFTWSLLGVSLTSLLFPCISPKWSLAPFLLGVFRCMQNFFAAAETPGGALFLLEDAPENKHNLLGALYDASSVLGGVFASLSLAYFAQYEGWIDRYWSYFFIVGGVGGVLGAIFRGQKEYKKTVREKKNYLYEVAYNYTHILQIACGSGFSYSIYFFVFTFMSMTLPHTAKVSQGDVTIMNSYLLIADVCLLCLFGYGVSFWNRLSLLRNSIVCLFLGLPLVVYYLPGASYYSVFCIRLFIVFLGTAFASTYYAWAYQIAAQTKVPCFALVIGTILGSQCIGYPGLWLATLVFQKTQSPLLASCPVLLSAVLIFLFLEREAAAKMSQKV